MNSVGQYTAKPKYREADGLGRETLTRGMVLDAYETIVEKAFVLADEDMDRWSYLVRDFANLSAAFRSQMCRLLDRYFADTSEEDRRRLWEKIRDEVNRHTVFKEAKWALSLEELEPLSQLVSCHRKECIKY
jgi:hypothetical protein